MTGLAPWFKNIKTIKLYLNRTCNLGCSYCSLEKKEGVMNLQTAKKVIEKFRNKKIKQTVILIGGEPLKHKVLVKKICEYTKDAGLKTELITNGLLLDEKTLRVIEDNNTTLIVSYDGYYQTTRTKSVDRLVSKIKLVKKYTKTWKKLNIAMTSDGGELFKNMHSILRLGVKNIRLSFVDLGEGVNIDKKFIKDYKQVLNLVKKEKINLRVQKVFNKTWLKEEKISCGIDEQISVLPNGDIIPCTAFINSGKKQYLLGNVDGLKKEVFYRSLKKNLPLCLFFKNNDGELLDHTEIKKRLKKVMSLSEALTH